MKEWAVDHPKAKLMAQKRAAILAAAKEVFLRQGYEGSSMETIAQAAGVSIMTLYRHAESKDDLFAAVISLACAAPEEEENAKEWEAFYKLPLREQLMTNGILFQQKLAAPDTIALMRTVMGEVSRFPDLAQSAYRGTVGYMESLTEDLLARDEVSQSLGVDERQKLGRMFLDRLLGGNMLRLLLDLGGLSEREKHERAEQATAEVLAALPGKGGRPLLS